ncbi:MULTISPECIES: hypothetical protein [unclassified Frankia]|uniref:hypothetical protein n=1 Tax=unclassified Frankia TaxID=2632575 RepID=UPI002AD28BD2|nr:MULTISPECIES: hypothetical protein [unclassified Frankia]
MTPTTIAMVVEGQGEVAALPVLVRRMAAELAPGSWVDLPRPYRVNRGTLVGAGGLETVVAAVAEQVGPAGGVLIMIDADDDCPYQGAGERAARLSGGWPCRSARSWPSIRLSTSRVCERLRPTGLGWLGRSWFR